MLRKPQTPRLEATEDNAVWLQLQCDADTRVRVRPASRDELQAAKNQAGELSTLAQVISEQLRSEPDPIARAKITDALGDEERAASGEASAWVIRFFRALADVGVLAVEDLEGAWPIEGGVTKALDSLLAVYNKAMDGEAVSDLGAEPKAAVQFLFEVGQAVQELSTLGNASSFISARRCGHPTAEAGGGAATDAKASAAV